MSTDPRTHAHGDQARTDRSASGAARDGGSNDLDALQAEFAALEYALAKACRRFERERRSIASDLANSAAKAGAELALRHYVSAEIDGVTARLARLVRRLRAIEDRA